MYVHTVQFARMYVCYLAAPDPLEYTYEALFEAFLDNVYGVKRVSFRRGGGE